MTDSASDGPPTKHLAARPRARLMVATAAAWALISLVLPDLVIHPLTGSLVADRVSWPLGFDALVWFPTVASVLDSLIVGLLAAGFTWLVIRLSGAPRSLWLATAYGALAAFVLTAGFRTAFVSLVLGYVSTGLIYTLLREDVPQLIFAVAGAYVGSRIVARKPSPSSSGGGT